MKLPIVTVAIATYNSEKLLPKTLEAIRNQTYPQDKIEILVIDGGSKDRTRKIAEQYGAIVLDNPKTEPVNAKFISVQNAKGKYLMTVDHDEVLENRDSIKIRVEALIDNPECKVALCSGYKRPRNYPALNQYISEFGDPFSLFMYNCSKDWKFFLPFLKKNYKQVRECENYICISFEQMKHPLIMELCCVGTLIDLDFFKTNTCIESDANEMVALFYIMRQHGIYNVIISKKDPLVHYSVDSLKAYFPKLKWRICNNVHYAEKGQKGFSGRERFQTEIKYKKYLFIPYSLLVPIPFIQGVGLAISRKNSIYLLHPIFCLYVTMQIIYQMILKIMGKTPKFRSYDGKKIIER